MKLQSCVCALALSTLLVPPLAAQAPLAAADLAELMGEWLLKMEMQGNPIEMTLHLFDADGEVEATLESERRDEPQQIEAIHKTESGIRLEWQREFGGQRGTLALDLALADGRLSGSFGDDGGLFTTEVVGIRAATDAEGEGEGDDDEDRRRRRRRRFGATADLVLAEKRIQVAYAELDREEFSQDYSKLGELADGEVFSFVGGRATKLKTEAPLSFGDTVIQAGNVAPNYPGVYSLWFKRVGDGWHLVFNEHADIWGSQYLTEADVAEVPLVRSDGEAELQKLKVELVEMGDGGLLRFAWGTHQWIAPFELAD